MAEQEVVTKESAATVSDAKKKNFLDELLDISKLGKSGDLGHLATKGLNAFIQELCTPQRSGDKISGALVNDMIAKLDQKISKQVDQVLHHQDFQKLESAWRSLKYLVDNTDFRENTKINILNVSKSELIDDFEDAPEIPKSALYKLAYTAEYGQFGGHPYGLIVGNFDFNPDASDIDLLKNIASISTMSHAPLIAAAGPEFFGVEAYGELPQLNDLDAIFEMPQYAKWNAFRDSEDARYVGLTCPRFLLRLPYAEDSVKSKKFDYQENVSGSHDHFLWGNAAFAMASRINNSFAKYRWSANIIGPKGGGVVEDLPIYNYEALGETQTKIPTEVLVSERREYELSEQGFIALTMRKGSNNAAFFSANSCQKPKTFPNTPEGKAAETNFKLGAQLPYLFIVSRLAHYIKVLQRENIGSWKERGDLERELNKWISQYVVDMENPSAEVKSKRPLRAASIEVFSVAGEPGWYSVKLNVRPHFKYMGAHFTLSLVGKLDKK